MNNLFESMVDIYIDVISLSSSIINLLVLNSCFTVGTDVESANECYEELESSWSSSAASSNASRTYSNTLPATSRLQRLTFIFGNNVVCDPKNRDFLKTNSDPADYPNGKQSYAINISCKSM